MPYQDNLHALHRRNIVLERELDAARSALTESRPHAQLDELRRIGQEARERNREQQSRVEQRRRNREARRQVRQAARERRQQHRQLRKKQRRADQAASAVGWMTHAWVVAWICGFPLLFTLILLPLFILGFLPWWIPLLALGAIAIVHLLARLAVIRAARGMHRWLAGLPVDVRGFTAAMQSDLDAKPALNVHFAGAAPDADLVADLVLAVAESSPRPVGRMLRASAGDISTYGSSVHIPVMKWATGATPIQRDFYRWGRQLIDGAICELQGPFNVEAIVVVEPTSS